MKHETYCKWFFSSFLSISLSDAKVERLKKIHKGVRVTRLPFATFDGISGSERHKYNAEQKNK